MKLPLFVYFLDSDDKARDATISMLQYEKWDLHYRSMAIFQDQESIIRKVLARFTDVCENQFSDLQPDNQNRIGRYIESCLDAA